MTKLIFRSGLTTIGGTVVEVIDNNERIIFDFGTVYGEEEQMPNVEGIYDNTSKYNDLVLISHLHLDHTKAMNLISSDIDIVMNEYSVQFINDLYNIGFDDLLGEKRDYQGMKNLETIKHGNFQITNILVDHDVKGASCFLIKTDDLVLFYSGDIRLHGRNSDLTYKMIEYIKSLDITVDVAIFEGVTISFVEDDYQVIATDEVKKYGKEEDFEQLVIDTVKEEQILFNSYIMGLERLLSILKLSQRLNKTICVNGKFGYLINKYYPEYDFVLLENDQYNLNKKVIQYNEINDNLLVIFDFNQRDKYPVFNDAALLQTGGEPLGEYDPRWKDLEKWCLEHNVALYPLGSSGHGAPEHIKYIINSIDMNYLMPLHSFKPHLVTGDNATQILPEADKEYIFNNHTLI